MRSVNNDLCKTSICWFLLLFALSFYTSTLAQTTPPYAEPLFTGPTRYAPSHAFDQVHLQLDLKLHLESEQVEGTALLYLTPLLNKQTVLFLRAGDMTIHKIEGGTSPQHLVPYAFTHHKDSLLITLPQAFALQDTFLVKINYTAKPSRGLYFFHATPEWPARKAQIWSQGEPEDNHYWFPVYDYPYDKLTSEVKATVAPPFRVLSNGKLLNVQQNPDSTRTYHYIQELPHAPYLIMIAAGAYEVVHQRVALNDSTSIPLEYWVYPEHMGDAQRTFGRTPDMVQFFSSYLNYPYPWYKYAQIAIQDFQFGGMENTSATTLIDYTIIDERAALDYSPDGLIAHELAHQWFGDAVTTEYWNHIWLNESFATYFDALFTEHAQGAEAFALKMYQNEQNYLREAHHRYQRPLVWNRWEHPINMFDAHSYPKGAWVLHMLRQRLGEDGFRRSLHRYLTTHAFKPVETHNLMDAIEEETGQHLDAFFEQWVFSAGHPQLDIRYTYDEPSGKLTLHWEQQQSGYLIPEIFHINLPIEVVTLDDTTRVTLSIQEKSGSFTIPLSTFPEYILIDPENTVLDETHLTQPPAAWVAQLRTSPYLIARLRAASHLKTFKDDPALLLALRDAFSREHNPAVRKTIVETIAVLPDSASVLSALLTAAHDHSSLVRRTAIQALGAFPHHATVADVARIAAETDSSYYVQAEAVVTLARIQAPDAYDYVQAALVTPSHREIIRQSAFEALKYLDIPFEEAFALVKEWTHPAKPTVVRAAAVRYLAYLANEHEEAFQYLLSLLNDKRFQVRSAVIAGLTQLARPEAIPYLEQRIPIEPDGRLIAALYRAIRTLKTSTQ